MPESRLGESIIKGVISNERVQGDLGKEYFPSMSRAWALAATKHSCPCHWCTHANIPIGHVPRRGTLYRKVSTPSALADISRHSPKVS